MDVNYKPSDEKKSKNFRLKKFDSLQIYFLPHDFIWEMGGGSPGMIKALGKISRALPPTKGIREGGQQY